MSTKRGPVFTCSMPGGRHAPRRYATGNSDIIAFVEHVRTKQRVTLPQTRRQKVFNRGALHLCRGGFTFQNLTKTHIYSAWYFNLGVLELCLGETKRTKPPVAMGLRFLIILTRTLDLKLFFCEFPQIWVIFGSWWKFETTPFEIKTQTF